MSLALNPTAVLGNLAYATSAGAPSPPNPFAGTTTVAACVQACTGAGTGQLDPICMAACIEELFKRIGSPELGQQAMQASRPETGICPECSGGGIGRIGCELGRFTCNVTLFAGIILIAALVIALVVLVTR